VKCAQPLALLVVLGACGDDDGSGAAPDPDSTTNTVPTIAGTPDTKAVIGQTYEFAPEAIDPDQDVLTFAVENRPGWASFSHRPAGSQARRRRATSGRMGTLSSVSPTARPLAA
jgi:hypothetical protein